MNADNFWRHAFREAYHGVPQGPGLNAIEQAALLPLVVEFHHRGLEDRDTAAIPRLLDDGAATLVKLTISNLDLYAAAYDAREEWTSLQFSFPADA